MKKLLILLIVLFMFTGCAPKDKPTVPTGCDIEEPCDDETGRPEGWKVSDLLDDETVVFSIVSITDQFSGTCIIFYSFDDCPWCYDALPVIQDVAKDGNVPVYYVSVARDERVEGNPGYDAAMEFFKDEIDEKMYMPFCAFVKDGVIVGSHTGTVEEHNAKETVISAEQIEELEGIYRELLNKMQ